MMNAGRIDRLVRADRIEQLLEEVLSNGRRLPLAARAVLHEAGSLEMASVGLALQRLVELTYTPRAVSVSLAERLAAGLEDFEQDSSGEIEDEGARLVARAIATCALDDLAGQAAGTGVELSAALRSARDAGVRGLGRALFEAQSVHAAHHPRRVGLVGTAIISCLVAWQLAGRAALTAELQHMARVDLLFRAIQTLNLGADRDCAGVLAICSLQCAPSFTHAAPIKFAARQDRPAAA